VNVDIPMQIKSDMEDSSEELAELDIAPIRTASVKLNVSIQIKYHMEDSYDKLMEADIASIKTTCEIRMVREDPPCMIIDHNCKSDRAHMNYWR